MTLIQNWNNVLFTSLAMEQFGGSFVQALGLALRRADSENQLRILDAFPDYIKQYGPGSSYYKHAERRYYGQE